MYRYKGTLIFNGLVTMTNKKGEVRVQHHGVPDSHDQIKPIVEAFEHTSAEYGVPLPKLVSTDNPSKGYIFFLDFLESLQDQKIQFNSGVVKESILSPYSYNPSNPFLEIIRKQGETDLAVVVMLRVTNKEKGLALECEWRIKFNNNGRKVKQWKVGLIQLGYFNGK